MKLNSWEHNAHEMISQFDEFRFGIENCKSTRDPSWKRKPQLLSTRWSDTSVKHIPQQRIACRIHKVAYTPPKAELSTRLINDPRNTIENWPTASPYVVLIALNIMNLNVICGYVREREKNVQTDRWLTSRTWSRSTSHRMAQTRTHVVLLPGRMIVIIRVILIAFKFNTVFCIHLHFIAVVGHATVARFSCSHHHRPQCNYNCFFVLLSRLHFITCQHRSRQFIHRGRDAAAMIGWQK